MNHLVVCGLNYHSSPIAIRERFIIPTSCLKHALHALARMPHIKEAAVVSTCNRTEVYALVSDVQAGLQEIESFFLSTQEVADHGALRPNFKLLREDVVLHLFRVASGLDSMVLGEGQIMAQVKDSHQAALEAGTAGPFLDQLFKTALNCGKRVRTETSMGRRAVSISSAAVELGRELLGPLAEKNVVVVGAGKMGKVLLKHLLSEGGNGPVVVLNRSVEKLVSLSNGDLPNAHRIKTSFTMDDLPQLAANADVVFVSTSAPQFLLNGKDLLAQKSKSNLCVIDISVPRNVNPDVAEVEGVKSFHADDLVAIVNKNMAEREALVAEAEDIVFDSLENFNGWQRSLLVVPTITELRQKIESIRLAQMAKSQSNGTESDDMRDKLEDISRNIINQILHHPTVQLKATTDYGVLRQQAEALRQLFNLTVTEPMASGHHYATQSSGSSCPFSESGKQIDEALKDFSDRLKKAWLSFK